MSTLPRIIYLHGNQATHWSFGWAPWLKSELEKRGFPTFFETFPDSIIARSQYWLPFLENHVKAGEQDVLLGWSSGAVAAMRYAEIHRLKGSVLIAPCYTDLGDDLEKQSGYYSTPWQWEAITSNQENIALFYGDDDPYIPQQEFVEIANRLNPQTGIIPGAGHFIEHAQMPEVLAYLIHTYQS